MGTESDEGVSVEWKVDREHQMKDETWIQLEITNRLKIPKLLACFYQAIREASVQSMHKTRGKLKFLEAHLSGDGPCSGSQYHFSGLLGLDSDEVIFVLLNKNYLVNVNNILFPLRFFPILPNPTGHKLASRKQLPTQHQQHQPPASFQPQPERNSPTE